MTTLDPVFEKPSTEKIRLYLGTGCGKTTAAFGLTLRALSKGMNVTLVFFDKLEENSSEGRGLRLLSDSGADGFGKLTIHYTGVNRLGTGPKGSFRLYSSPNGILPEDKDAAKQGLTYIAEGLMRKDDIVIGDELLDVARVGLVDFDYVKQVLSLRQDPTVLVLTGRRAPDWLMQEASTISTTTQLRHHGRAIEGLDC
ncbi:MAG TPA: cob(I)yrinic acid a,c-diamide adenosyltransferase [Candidatus Obscuribacter sp.]|nr:cob(I)yrinic acid a,c-diamide adenosyltransferase [Candidatus Obscuribacter sp.]HMY53094.1 cob(I)yrinic acid a,c-diamide adenosyltransferase [Candidatus Obscuribacter sp.]HND06037.1 cob(I)yrinic acid a,c-diamide adenosyltransferase [Candidatus Obscuribacter sp.]HND66905.1 cob(I)yrinic acid a,c-diamide adenosyltransferase [Candidatus Obscuribacter sp.]HNG76984.1 cob(I)yrinic acid a,c-diamide adenosyltransferase [Candidatus Obscuribacter sp.]